MVTAAGLLLDARSLIYAGLAIFAAMVALWLWAWARPIEVPVAGEPMRSEFVPPDLSEQDRALWTLRTARRNAAAAVKRSGNVEALRAAFHECEAAMLTANRQFGAHTLEWKRGGYFAILTVMIEYFDIVIPLAASGHTDQVKEKTDAFVRRIVAQNRKRD